ncbi:DUF3999 domain-containing protein [Citrobacter rodentium]|uniref:Exported protein n=2 Tax=Citrobacter rodentium TaxID=67825 RepID=D2TKY8_CITRI|nr:DUF3999 domain-containing protein [Citrobacter rodentium]KIQ53173.1 membrane protein [Citrobacter rodentium]QBY31675.1 DUF3999 domain-containing protein [Citrobacter rodentium]UHO30967.1 DUF3999 domain-containing protein [Citrobacter rodentium NBRC 105723 = DSM 16636]CBG87229.1 putative exported protein [Citrobacter rodentium ICC168]HAT8012901.1 DUF3999 domain-containing protein [Citrobacter rodentium NBRC 105723 = DSM 16636]
MKWMKALLCSALLSAAGTVAGSDEAKESPVDYATGVMLETTGASPWYRLPLPQTVYEGSAWPDLRDVRVFNHAGETVPFALVAQKAQPVTPETMKLRLFPLDMSPVAAREQGRQGESFVLRSKAGIEIQLNSDEVNASGQSYLLTLPEARQEPFSLAQLRLDWRPPAGNWQGKASIYSSRDLRYWRSILEDAPLMDLTREGDRLKMDTISARLTLSTQGNRYLLVILDAQSPALTINSVSAIADSRAPESERVVIGAQEHRVSDEEALWRWKQPQPLSSLSIALQNEGVLPVALAWRSEENAAWQPLTKTVLYRLDGQRSQDIALSGQEVEAVRITTINARLPETLPAVSGARDSYQLVFNAQGKGPYMLAWGNRAAIRADIELDRLIPASLRKTHALNDLPWAIPQQSVTPGGEARLSATSAAERQSQWQTLLVWGALILGVAVLALMAFRIWREVKKDGGA